MTSISRAVLVFIGAWGLAGCAVPFQVKRITSNEQLPENAVLYSLPRAKIVVEIPVTRENRDKAVCAAAVKNAKDAVVLEEFKKALKKHGLDDWSDSVPKFDEKGTRSEYKLTADQAPTLTLQAEPDPDAVFAVDVASEKFKRKSLALTLSEMGVLEAGGVTAEDATTEVVVEVVATVVTIAVTVAGLLDAGRPEPGKELEHCRLTLGKLDKLEKRRLDIVEERDELLARAKVSSDPSKALATAKLLLDDVKAQKDDLLDLFRGVVIKEMAKIRCEVTPSAEETDWPLLTLRGATLEGASCAPPEGWKSAEAAATAATAATTAATTAAPGTGGAPASGAPAGAMPTASAAPAGATPAASGAPAGTASAATAGATPVGSAEPKEPGTIVIKLQLTAKSDPVLETAKESKNRYRTDGTANPSTGFVYRVPARTSLKLSQDVWGEAGKKKTSVYSTTDALIPQMGVLLALPTAGTIKNTKANYSVAVHPASGAAKEIKIEYGTKDVPDTSTLAKDAAPLLDKASPHKRLEKEKAGLELEQKIFELRCAKAKREGIEPAECKAEAKAEE